MENTARVVQFGPMNVAYPSEDLGVLEDCNGLLHDTEALHEEMEKKGYYYNLFSPFLSHFDSLIRCHVYL